MAFVLEDGTGIANANAYISEAFADTYHTDRFNTAWTSLTDSALKEAAIIKATDYLDFRWDFIGDRKKAFELQSLKWPRIDAFVERDQKVVQSNVVPLQVQYATAEYALRVINAATTAGTTGDLAPDLVIDESGGKITGRREKVGPLEEEFKFSGSFGLITLKPYPAADNILRDLLVSGRMLARA